jgi:bifunctional non-homologous end joining protein LigD
VAGPPTAFFGTPPLRDYGTTRTRPKLCATSKEPSVSKHSVELTHPDRVLWPDVGVTKAGLAEFYAEIADWVLPHLVNRPLSLVRCPSGAASKCFFQKHAWEGMGRAIKRKAIGDDEVLFIQDLDGLIALVQASVLEIHPWGSKLRRVEAPDRVTFDLDPGEDVAWTALIDTATEVRERLRSSGLESFVKTTGGKGLHVVVPLTPKAGWEAVKSFAQGVAEGMAKDSPTRYTAVLSKSARGGKVFIDYLRNGRGATAVAAYSTRARAGATVSTPLAWDELSPAIRPSHFNIENLPTRLRHLGADPWAEIGVIKQVIPSADRKKRR